jgi:hypothetical protein
MDRFARQRLLAAVGEPGQARIVAATFEVDDDASVTSVVAREYLERAGAARFAPPTGAPPFVHAAELHHPAAREFAEGAWRALSQLRSVLFPRP